MNDLPKPTAAIIPFPLIGGPTAAEPTRQLQRALGKLNAALIGQASAIAAWRKTVEALQVSTRRLGDSLQCYGGELARLDGKVADLHTEALALSQMSAGSTA
jgi:hypothetical protein